MRKELIDKTLAICQSGDIPAAIALQKELAVLNDCSGIVYPISTVAGVDIAYDGNTAYAAAVVMDYASLDIIEKTSFIENVSFPYISGLLSFREFPAILNTMNNLKTRPDLLIFDGQGIAHPRKMGIAAHSGILLDIPSIGCAKSRLCGEYEPPGKNRFDFSILRNKGEDIGIVLRTRENTKPVFVSPGYKVPFGDLLEIIRHLTGSFRLPLPTHLADRMSKQIKGSANNSS
jgi:deoxyribonuclease V